MKNKGKPFGNTRLVTFLDRKISDLRRTKTQTAIASDAGFRHPNMLAMIKRGSSKLPLDRVAGLAKALDCDAALLFRMAVEQMDEDTTATAIEQIFGTIVTQNELAWLEAIRGAAGHTDPALTARAQRAIRDIFGK